MHLVWTILWITIWKKHEYDTKMYPRSWKCFNLEYYKIYNSKIILCHIFSFLPLAVPRLETHPFSHLVTHFSIQWPSCLRPLATPQHRPLSIQAPILLLTLWSPHLFFSPSHLLCVFHPHFLPTLLSPTFLLPSPSPLSPTPVYVLLKPISAIPVANESVRLPGIECQSSLLLRHTKTLQLNLVKCRPNEIRVT